MDTLEVSTQPKPALVPELRDEIAVASAKLQPGMFVIALDRPWEGTPFLLQAFLIEEVEQIRIMRELCTHVVIDPRRSSPESLRELEDLYVMPEAPEAEEEDEEARVKIRYLESSRSSFDPKSPSSFSLSKIRENVTATLREIWESNPDSSANPALQKAAESTAPASLIPRFAPTQVLYASTTSGKGASREPSNAARRALARDNRSRRGEEPDASSERLARFDALIAALHPDWSSFMPGVELLRKLGARLKRRAKRPQWRRATPARPAKSQQLARGPQTIDLVIYRDRTSIQVEVPRARDTVVVVEETIELLRGDLIAEASVRVDGLPVAVESMVQSIERNADALIWVARVREQDSLAYTHSIKVASYLLAFGRHLGFPSGQLSELATVGLLMDVGKLDVDEQILNKPDALEPDEFEAVKAHVEKGLERLQKSMHLSAAVREGIAHHHEWINGEGYPAGLAGEEISIFGRMAAIVDAYAALTTARPYAPPLSSYEALQVIYSQADQKFHAPLVEQFVRAIGLFPVGSLVLLSTEEVAVVTAQDKAQRLEPRVLVLMAPSKNALERPYEMDLARRPKDSSGKPIKILRSLPAGVHGIDFRDFYIS